MKFLTLLDYANIIALIISTILVLSLKIAGWESPYLMGLMILLLILVVVNRMKNSKYRKQVKDQQPITLTAADKQFGFISIGVMLLLFVLVLIFPGLR
ncbi:hypothetical protein [Macrococcus lamae]|uniref:Uncharacterized protein n=1 Tax=Macrococcus lamae TaxID=198484 RepID=A0A4R6BUH8_9STAP|nr:hypothetical protein [Macrococcus lamae]TDM11953.1 hypothetical protein ERX29_05000 [Macrococcus lamae]